MNTRGLLDQVLKAGQQALAKKTGQSTPRPGTASADKACQSWQANQGQGTAAVEPRTVDRVPEHEAEAHGRAVLIALIAAAKADGHVDDQERQAIEAEMAKLDNDPELRSWLQRELEQPLDPAKVAAAAETPEMAAEMYLASLILIDDQQYMEKAYLDGRARRLRLEPGLRAELEREAAAV